MTWHYLLSSCLEGGFQAAKWETESTVVASRAWSVWPAATFFYAGSCVLSLPFLRGPRAPLSGHSAPCPRLVL